MKSPWNDHVILQGTGLHRNKLAWDWRHRSEEQRVRSVRESNIHKGLWRWTACRSLQVVLYQSSRVILSYPPIFMNFPQQAICSSCKWMCINSPLPCKSLVTKGRKKRDYVKRDNMQIELVIKENIWEIKIFQSWLYCPPALSCLWTLVLGDQMLMDRMSVLSLLSCGVSLSLSLSFLSSWSFITSCTTLGIASQVPHTAQCRGWHRLTGCATAGSETTWWKLDMNACLQVWLLL